MANFENIEKKNKFYKLIKASDTFYELRDSVELQFKKIEYPKKPKEPKPLNPTDIQLEDFLKEKAEYSAELDNYLSLKKIYDENNLERNEILTYACHYYSRLLDIKSEAARQEAWRMAWDTGQDYGYDEVYLNLTGLVGLLEIMQKSFS